MQEWLRHALDEFDNGNFQDGDLLSHSWLEYALKIPTAQHLHQVKQIQFTLLNRLDTFRDHLLIMNKIALENVRGQGYRIVPPNEQAEHAARTALNQVIRGLRTGTKIMLNTRLQGLTSDERTRHLDAETRLAGMVQMVNSQRKSVFQAFNPKLTKKTP